LVQRGKEEEGRRDKLSKADLKPCERNINPKEEGNTFPLRNTKGYLGEIRMERKTRLDNTKKGLEKLKIQNKKNSWTQAYFESRKKL